LEERTENESKGQGGGGRNAVGAMRHKRVMKKMNNRQGGQKGRIASRLGEQVSSEMGREEQGMSKLIPCISTHTGR
jgi:hypothetical protein